MKQGTDEWHAWRRAGAPASFAAIIMDCDKWDRTWHWLWRWYRGDIVETVTPAMQRGLALEPEARAAYEARTGTIMQPMCLEWAEWPILRASLDGITFDGDAILEIKCPGSEDHGSAMAGVVPWAYELQCQQQLCVTSAKVCHYWSYYPAPHLDPAQQAVLVEVYPRSTVIAELIDRWRAFWRYVERDEEPPLSAHDTVTRADATWCALAAEYRQCEAAALEWQRKKEAVREALLAEAGAVARVAGGGIALTRYWRRGEVDYGKIPALRGVALDEYRKPSRAQVRITVQEG